MTPEQQFDAIKAIVQGWIESDGFQEGADGATSVAEVIYGEATVHNWVIEAQAKAKAAYEAERRAEAALVHLNCGHKVQPDVITKLTESDDFRPGTKTFCPVCAGDEYVRNADGSIYRLPGSPGVYI